MTTSNRIPAATLSRLMTHAWKDAREAAKVSGKPVRAHMADAMKRSWAQFRTVIHRDRHHAAQRAAVVAATPVISVTITSAVSDKQRAYAEKVVAKRAAELAVAFRSLRADLESDEERALVDGAVARFAGGPAEFWIGLQASRAPEDVARILALRVAGLPAPVRECMPHSIKMAALV